MILRSTNIKQGATFALAGLIYLPDGTWSIESKVRQQDGTLVSTLNAALVAPVSPATQYGVTLSATADETKDWPLGTLLCDIKFTDSLVGVLITPTFDIVVEATQTFTPPSPPVP